MLKGNGYGFGVDRLAARAAWLGVDTVAVGMYHEVTRVAEHFHGSIMVLTPWRPFETRAVFDSHVVHTVGRLEDLRALAGGHDGQAAGRARAADVDAPARLLRARPARGAAHSSTGVAVEGVAIHLPISQGSHLTEVNRLMTDVVAAGLPTRPGLRLAPDRHRARDCCGSPTRTTSSGRAIGTQLWLGDRDALRVRATVLDVHPVERGDVYGYRSRTAPAAGTILVVSGGTAHGIGLEAPTGGATLKDRAARIARGGLDAAGFVRSPYTVDGKARLFAEPPHMQASMLFLSHGAQVPEVGDEVDVRVRFTATTFDETVISDVAAGLQAGSRPAAPR